MPDTSDLKRKRIQSRFDVFGSPQPPDDVMDQMVGEEKNYEPKSFFGSGTAQAQPAEAEPAPAPSTSEGPETPPPAGPVATMVSKARSLQGDTVKVATMGNPFEKPDRTELNDLLKKYEGLANDPQYQRSAAPDSQKELAKAIQDAKGLYQERANRNDWLEVAQTLGRAVAQFGAARSGLDNNQDMSNLAMGPAIDYGARNDRAFREMRGSISDAGEQADIKRRNYLDESANKKEQYGRQEDALKTGLKQAQDEYDTGTRSFREGELASIRDAAMARRDAAREGRESERVTTRENTSEIRRVDAMITDARRKTAAAGELANNYLNYDSLDKKGKAKTDQAFGDLAGKAGADPATLEGIKTKSKEGSGVFGMFQSEKPDVKAKLLNEQVVGPLKAQLQQLEDYRRQLSQGSQVPSQQATEAPAQAPAAAPAPSGGRVKVKSPSGQVGTIPAEQVEKALSQGFTRVE